jgi:hypothetical protein
MTTPATPNVSVGSTDDVSKGGLFVSTSSTNTVTEVPESSSTTTPATPDVFTGSTENESKGGLFIDTSVSGIADGAGIVEIILGDGLTGTSLLGPQANLSIDSTVATLTGTQILSNKTLASPVLNTSISGTAFLDEDNMASDSPTKVASQQSIKTYVDTAVAGVPVGDITEITLGAGLTGTSLTGPIPNLSITATQTAINSILNTGLVVGGDSTHNINFAIDNEIRFGTGGFWRASLDNDKLLLGAGIDLVFEGATNNAFETTLTVIDPTAVRTISLPNATGTLALTTDIPQGVVTLTGTQTLTNKTLTTPIISSISNTGTITIPTTTDTLVGRATADTLTNKTLTTPIISSISNTGTITLPTTTDTLVGRDTVDTLTQKTLSSPIITDAILNIGLSGTAFLDEDNMASDSATKVASQQSIKTYVDTQVATIPVGDITGVEAGTGMTGGGSSGDVTLNVIGGTGITANAGEITIDSTVTTLTGSQTLTNKTLTSPVIDTGISGSAFLDEDNMASDSPTKVASQQSIKTYVDTEVAGAAVTPGGLNTYVQFNDGLSGFGGDPGLTFNKTTNALYAGEITISNAGTIGSVTNTDAIAIAQSGDVTLTHDLRLKSDSVQIFFGDDEEIRLTHINNSGLSLEYNEANYNNPVNFILQSKSQNLVANAILASLKFSDNEGYVSRVSAGIHAIAEGTFSSTLNPTKLVFTTGINSAAGPTATPKMTLSSAGNLLLEGNITTGSQKELRFNDADSSNYVGFKSPATVASDLIWTLPATDGTSGQALVTDASGVLSWATPGGSTVAADDITLGDAAVTIATTTGNITIDAQGADTDIIFKGTDNTTDITALTLDMSDAGSATFNHDVIAKGNLNINTAYGYLNFFDSTGQYGYRISGRQSTSNGATDMGFLVEKQGGQDILHAYSSANSQYANQFKIMRGTLELRANNGSPASFKMYDSADTGSPKYIEFLVPSSGVNNTTLTLPTSSGTLALAGGGGGTPGGATTQVQFNDGGAFGGDAGLTYDKTNGQLDITSSGSATTAPIPSLTLKATSTGTTGAFGGGPRITLEGQLASGAAADFMYIDSVTSYWGTGTDLVVYTRPNNGTPTETLRVGRGGAYFAESIKIGSNSAVYSSGTMRIASDSLVEITNASGSGSNIMADFTNTGAARLYYNDTVKLATTNTGVDITGNLKSGTLEITSSNAAASNNATIGYDSNSGLVLRGQGANNDITLVNDLSQVSAQVPSGLIGLRLQGTPDNGSTTVPLKVAGLETIWVPASSMRPRLTDGMTLDHRLGYSTSNSWAELEGFKINSTVITGSYGFTEFQVAMPKSWNGSSFTARHFFFGASSSAPTIQYFYIRASSWRGSPIGSFLASNQFGSVASISTVSANNNSLTTLNTGTFTANGTVTGDGSDIINFQVYVDTTSMSATNTYYYLGTQIFFTTNAKNDA